MREAVSDILEERAQVAAGLSRMVVASLIAHGLFVSTMIFLPSVWTGKTQRKENVMTISLGGAEGPNAGGMTPLAARPVQEVAPTDRTHREPPPAPKPPEMTAPEPAAKPLPKNTKPIEKPAETKSAKPTRGADVKTGAAVAETGSTVQTPFGGLSTSGGGGDGATFDVKNFCCPAYLQTMRQMIHANWKRNQGVPGRVVVQLVVQRDGRISDVQIVESGGEFLDIASRRLMATVRQFPPLPREYPDSTFTIQIGLTYIR